ncbi:M20 metallopeptidase family protein [Winogradskyella forsetii]|uniref:M20 metallopeptidase family protein n=1 Tax=Winogradskyella forsetii TaxID=2686077 RepID=UPI0015B95067|nr:M20/M25/M40 family metallo-hydrolase [Winogradskyella forsetii]
MILNKKLVKVVCVIQLAFLPCSILGQNKIIDTSIHKLVQEQTNLIFDSLVKIRRDLHMYPELAEQEKRTSKTIALYLKSLGLEVHTHIGGYGVVGILRTNKKGKRIAWRTDIDALESNHPDVVNFLSKNKGLRHICGHDVHTTIALGMAKVLTSLKDSLTGTVYFIFQPAEENWVGAKAMINDGLLNLIDPEEIYALHIAPMSEGIISTKSRNPYADYKGIEVTLKNTEEKDTLINYTKELLLNLQNIAADSKFWDNRNLLDPNIGLGSPNTIFKDYVTVNPKITVKETGNEISIKAYLSAEKDTQLELTLRQIKEKFQNSEYATQYIDSKFYYETALMLNDEKLTSATLSAISDIYGNENVLPLYGAIPDGRGDDFAFFQREIPGVYFLLGASDFEKGIVSMPHSPSFGVDENCIKSGVNFFSSMIIERLKY